MKLKLDENLPASAAVRLRELGFDADTVVDEKLGGSDDATVRVTTGKFIGSEGYVFRTCIDK